MSGQRIVLAGGLVLDRQGERSADVVIDPGTGLVEAIGPGVGADLVDATILDVTGCVVTPGFVDLATHLREPGDEAAETVRSGSRSAALGGYTGVVATADTDPCLDSASTLQRVQAAATQALCDVRAAGALSVGRNGHELAPLGELFDLGVRVFGDAGRPVGDAGFLRRALEYVGGLAADGVRPVVMLRCEDTELAAAGHMHEGEWSVRLGLAGRPAEAEVVAVARDLVLARLTGASIHLQQVSTAGAVDLIRAAKAEGIAVTADVSPHHLSLTDAACAGYDPVFKVSPPLRTAADVDALRAALADGTIDAIATDHSPHSADAKERPFDQAPAGVVGLETALAVALADSGLDLARIVALLSWQPAAIAGMGDRHGRPIEPGSPANLTVIDPDLVWTVRGAEMASHSTNTPFEGRELRGKVRHTVYDGEFVVMNGRVVR